MRNHIQVMHGLNLGQIGRRDPAHYGAITFRRLEQPIDGFADELGVDTRYFPTNFEAEFVKRLHRVEDIAGLEPAPCKTHLRGGESGDVTFSV
jgi:3-dehydroquinate dehydratase II